jgi:hypothetical protein
MDSLQGLCALLLFSLSESVRQVWLSDVNTIISLSRSIVSSQLSDNPSSSHPEKEDDHLRILREKEEGCSSVEMPDPVHS